MTSFLSSIIKASHTSLPKSKLCFGLPGFHIARWHSVMTSFIPGSRAFLSLVSSFSMKGVVCPNMGGVILQDVVEGPLIIPAELLHQLMIMTHGYSPLRFQPVPHPTGSWSSPSSFLLYHLVVLLLCFQQKMHETNIQHVKGCKVIHGSGEKTPKSSSQKQMCTARNLEPKWWTSEETAVFIPYLVLSYCRRGVRSKNKRTPKRVELNGNLLHGITTS